MRKRGELVASQTYQTAPVCVGCGNTPLLAKMAAERMAHGFRNVGGVFEKCRYHKGWHVLIDQAADEQRIGRTVKVPMPPYRP
ncbi:hypothetical protein SAMN05192558_105232 [Actinokineospora alba]|uniref:Uncharacterized protein n=1 Tax=Actinokineospora alba TaxID=504798 RepID=A0A1H0N7X4_9PSEU|nr:hypothetical protein [Actinokineospora alba]TDP68603.1 hypothetical protein C8E96_4168 [Actinokineospora alba]SDH82650.1 hypothetical protein SAMN05421871_102282 [Actinokineospora alba]SDO88585.1 hypothetical protein SAMN05192558_105232 [Actinokineospora alba]